MRDLTKYALSNEMEPLCIQLLCSDFGDNCISIIYEDAFDDPVTQHIFKAVYACKQEYDKCPTDLPSLTQQITLTYQAGKITKQEYKNIIVACCAAFACTGDMEMARAQFLQQIKTVARYREIDQGHREMAETGSTHQLQSKLNSIESIDASETIPAINFLTSASAAFACITSAVSGELQTGIPEYDMATEGGFIPGESHVICGVTGSGKSRAQTGVENVFLGNNENVYHVGNELPPAKKMSMMIACALKVPYNAVLKNIKKRAEYEVRYDKLLRDDPRGFFEYKWYDPDEYTVETVWEEILRRQDILKLEFKLISMDFLAKLRFVKYDSRYDGIRHAVEFIGARMVEHKKVLLTTHQAKQRMDIATIPLGINDAKDCSNLPAFVDSFNTLSPLYGADGVNEDRSKVKFNAAKLRDYEGIDPFVLTHQYGMSALHEAQLGWRPNACKPAYKAQSFDTDGIL